MELFKLPRKLGLTAQGEEIVANTGRFGPYVKYGAKYVSLKTDDPYTITEERALEVIREKEIADANRLILDFPDAGIQVLNGRYGPYITDKARNAKIPKERDPKSLSLTECQEMLAAAPARTFGKWGKKGAKGKTPAKTAAKSPAKTAATAAIATATPRAGAAARARKLPAGETKFASAAAKKTTPTKALAAAKVGAKTPPKAKKKKPGTKAAKK
jgi:DNA topoisomerase-1